MSTRARAARYGVVVSAWICVTRPGFAEPAPSTRFVWQRDAGAEMCDSSEALRAKIATALGRDPFSSADAPDFRGTVQREGAVLTARLWLRERDGTETSRELRSSTSSEPEASARDCASLTDAVALALALSLDRHEARARARARARSGETANPARRTALADSGTTSEGRAAPPRFSVLAEVGWRLGLLPRASAGLGLTLRYWLGQRVALTAGGEWLPPQSERGQFSVGLTTARVGVCAEVYQSPSFGILGCTEPLVGALRVQNEAGVVDEAGTHPWFGVGLNGRVRTRLSGSWGAEFALGGVAPIQRPIYETLACPFVGFQQPIATLGVSAAAGLQF